MNEDIRKNEDVHVAFTLKVYNQRIADQKGKNYCWHCDTEFECILPIKCPGCLALSKN